MNDKREAVENSVGLREGNISLVLDSYDDIFSDFDPRPYSEKALSDDFLLECKRAARDKEDRIGLRLLVPSSKRNNNDESKIKKRLREHFHKHFKEKEMEIKAMKKEGITWFFFGALIMVTATMLYKYQGFFFNFLFIIAEPAGWFTFWEGLSKVFIDPKSKMPDYLIYKKLSSSEVIFSSY